MPCLCYPSVADFGEGHFLAQQERSDFADTGI